MFEISLSTEVVITVVFWVFLYEDPGNAKERANAFMQHLNPLLILMTEFILNPWLFHHSHVLFLVGLSFLYIPTNFIGTKVKGEPIYGILSWESMLTAYYLMGIVGLLICSFHMLALISKLRVDNSRIETVIINKDAEASTSLLMTSMQMSI